MSYFALYSLYVCCIACSMIWTGVYKEKNHSIFAPLDRHLKMEVLKRDRQGKMKGGIG